MRPHHPGPSRREALRVLGLTGLGLAAAPALAACGRDTAPPLSSGKAALRFWTHDPGYSKTFQAALRRPALMQGSRFRYTLNVTQSNPTDLVTRLVAQAIADGDTPDLVGMVVDQFPRVMRDDLAGRLFTDLTATVAPHHADLLKLPSYSIAGTPYCLESDNSVSVYYYRHDEFARHGIPHDLDTWEELAEAGAGLHRRTGQYLGMVSTGNTSNACFTFFQFLLQRGGQVFDEHARLRLDSPEAVQTLTFLRDGVRSGFLVPLIDPYGSACAAALKSGRLIGTAMPNWYNQYGLQANCPEQKGKWRLRLLPRFAAGGHTASTWGGTAFCVVKDKPGSQAALELLRRVYLTRAGQILRYRTGGYLPTLRSLYRDPAFTGVQDAYLGGQRVFDVYAQAAADLPAYYQSPDTRILTDVLGGHVLDAVLGRAEPAAALRAGLDDYREQVKR
ncbi:ABC transporter substrate-binding protein [Streptomyces sp. NPDC059740]|uniref:ABC transporter substrate-binding protein n=1 Tax=Streptomyces sp. NPDC059740 TaxID=3346926 RepID=UPI00365F9012